MKRIPLASALVPEVHLGRVMFDLARAVGFSPRLLPPPSPPAEALANRMLLDRWVESAAEYFGVEAEPVEGRFSELDEMVAKMAPCVLRLPDGKGGHGIVAVVESARSHVVVLLRGQARRKVASSEVLAALRKPIERELAPTVMRWTENLPLSDAGRRRAWGALLVQIAGQRSVPGAYLLRPRPGASFPAQLRHSGDLRRFGVFVVLTIVQVLLAILGWSSLFDAALGGKLDKSTLLRWSLLALSIAIVEVVRSFLVGRINVSAAATLKRRILAGALSLEPEEVRSRGSGGLLALISESEVLETAGIGSVVSLLSAVVSLASAAIILSRGAGGALHVGLLAGWTVVVALGLVALNRRTKRWVDFRVGMTNRLVERMVGHRTRMAQEPVAARHKDEDGELELYHATSREMDRMARLVQGLPSRGWLLAGFVALLPALWQGNVDPRVLLVAIAGLFQAQSAFADVSATVTNMLNLVVAWNRTRPLFEAAAREEPYGLPAASVQELGKSAEAEDDAGAVLEARRVAFRYGTGGEPVLRGVNLRLSRGDRILLEGASGGGKSTLASLLAGLKSPDAGLVLHHGLDRATLGTGTWRKKVATVPQFHENHLLAGSLLFNLLLGRRWPAAADDVALAETVCRSLGLGPLLERMPAGLEQVVGETGWQLSHGERTRVYLARALLQGAEVVIVDESFGALDPHSLRVAVEATWERASTLVVIAHP